MGFSAELFIDKHHPRADETCKVSVRVTIDRKRRYYKTDKNLTPKEFEEALFSEKPSKAAKELGKYLRGFEDKASDILDELPIATFEIFEKYYLKDRAAKDTIKGAFDDYAEMLREEGRISTASGYECAAKSLETFKANTKFVDVDPSFLRRYEKWMLDKGNSPTTVGMYLRNLRFLFNERIREGELSKEYYPFGRGKYQIPTGKNIKKALNLSEIEKIFKYSPPQKGMQKAKDFWFFLYLSNGMNVKDMCLLKYGDIHGKFIRYTRAKSILTKRERRSTDVPLLDEAKAIIDRWGSKPVNSESFIFPILADDMTPEKERAEIQNLTQFINKNMKRVAKELEIESDVTTYVARHSYASVLYRSNTPIEEISESLTHADIKTTKSYLASFEEDTKMNRAKSLLDFNKTKNNSIKKKKP